MRRLLLALAALATAAPAFAAPPPNSYVERLKSLSELQRRAVLRGALVNSGQFCRRVDLDQYRGPFRNLVMWSVRCSSGGDYGLFIGPDGSAQVRTCEDLAKLHLPTCMLPPAPRQSPPPKRTPGRH